MICRVATERARPASRSDSSASRRHSSDDSMFMRAIYPKEAASPVTKSPDCHNSHLRCKLSSIQVPAAGAAAYQAEPAGLSNIESRLGGIEWRKLLRTGSFAMVDTAFTRSGHWVGEAAASSKSKKLIPASGSMDLRIAWKNWCKHFAGPQTTITALGTGDRQFGMTELARSLPQMLPKL